MNLKIVSTNWVLYQWKVSEVVVPTKDWEIWILPNHEAYTWVIKWWICKFKTDKNWDFIKDGEYNIISIWDGVVYTDGKEVRIAVSSANATIEKSKQEIEEMKKHLQEEIEKAKAKWSLEEVEKALFKMNKLEADLELKKHTK